MLATVRRNTFFIDLLQSMVSYAHSFKREYVVSLSAGPFTSIIDDMNSSDSLSSESRLPYFGYVRVRSLVLKHKIVLPLLIDLSFGYAATTNLGVKYVHGTRVYSAAKN